MKPAVQDWNPETYARFRGLRLRPAVDLVAQIAALPAGDIVDLGCGNGSVGPVLAQRFPGHSLIGVDNSPTMLKEAGKTGSYKDLLLEDAALWQPNSEPALIFSNAACHWLPDHDVLLPHLASMLANNGILAVQMPRQQLAPSHRLLREVAERLFPETFDFSDWRPQVAEPAFYQNLLAPLGDLNLWETEYFQKLVPNGPGHPVRQFTQSTAMRPILERLDAGKAKKFTTEYDRSLAAEYPLQPDGSALLPFRRLFFTLTPS